MNHHHVLLMSVFRVVPILFRYSQVFTYSPLHPLKEIIRILQSSNIMIIDAPNISCFQNISYLLRGKILHWDFKKHYLEQVPETTCYSPCNQQKINWLATFVARIGDSIKHWRRVYTVYLLPISVSQNSSEGTYKND